MRYGETDSEVLDDIKDGVDRIKSELEYNKISNIESDIADLNRKMDSFESNARKSFNALYFWLGLVTGWLGFCAWLLLEIYLSIRS